MQFLLSKHMPSLKKKLSNVHLHSKKNMQRYCLLTKVCISTPRSFHMFPLYYLGPQDHQHSVQYLSILISLGNTGPMMSSDYNCFWMAEQQSPSDLKHPLFNLRMEGTTRSQRNLRIQGEEGGEIL